MVAAVVVAVVAGAVVAAAGVARRLRRVGPGGVRGPRVGLGVGLGFWEW